MDFFIAWLANFIVGVGITLWVTAITALILIGSKVGGIGGGFLITGGVVLFVIGGSLWATYFDRL